MNEGGYPISWKDAAAAYDPRGLPFLRYFVEAGLTQKDRPSRIRILARNTFAVDDKGSF